MSSKSTHHWHHIIPKHIGGSDHPSNLIYLSIEDHAEAHRVLYETYGRWQDKAAWLSLSKQITHAEAIKMSQKLRDTSYMQTKEYKEKISKANKGKVPWNKNKKNSQCFKSISGSNHYSAIGCTYKGKTYKTIKDAIKDTGLSKYRLDQHPDFIRHK